MIYLCTNHIQSQEYTWMLLLSEYWAQFSFLLLGCGYIIKILFDLLLKRKEVNHTLYQQSKLSALRNFNNAYSDSKAMFRKLPEFEIFNHTISAVEIDNLILPTLSNLDHATNEIEMFFEDDIASKFRKINDKVESINDQLVRSFACTDNSVSPTIKSIDYQTVKNTNFEEGDILLKEVLTKIRKSHL